MKNILSIILLISISSISFANGKATYNSLGCAACHGATGISIAPNYPNLAGQNSAYTVKQLKDFQSGARKDPTMSAMAVLTKGKEKEIAGYLSSLK